MIKYIILLLTSSLAYYSKDEYITMMSRFIENSKNIPYFIGIAAFCLVYIFMRNTHNYGFFRTLRHELCHMLFSLISLGSIESMNVTSKNGGDITHRSVPNVFITLAPYFFPIITVFFLGVKMIVKPDFIEPLKYLIGFALAFDFTCFITDLHPKQTDLSVHGKPFSYVFVLLKNMLTSGVVVSNLNTNSFLGSFGWLTNNLDLDSNKILLSLLDLISKSIG